MFRRRSHPDTTATAEREHDNDSAVAVDPRQKTGPTPKRSEAQKTRKKQVNAPKDKKAATRLARQRMREDRETQRNALLTGDERNLPARDRGPVRKYARDWVDSHTTAAEFFLPGAVVILILSILPSSAVKNVSLLLWLAAIVAIVLDSVRVKIMLTKRLKANFPDGNLKGAAAYALLRTLQVRRLRLPKPQVKRGEKI